LTHLIKDITKTNAEFNKNYEKAIDKIFDEASTHFLTTCPSFKALKDELAKKRAFGIKKYGEISFQGSPENAMKVNTSQHAREELIDYMNYTLHDIYKAFRLNDISAVQAGIDRLSLAYTLYCKTKDIDG